MQPPTVSAWPVSASHLSLCFPDESTEGIELDAEYCRGMVQAGLTVFLAHSAGVERGFGARAGGGRSPLFPPRLKAGASLAMSAISWCPAPSGGRVPGFGNHADDLIHDRLDQYAVVR